MAYGRMSILPEEVEEVVDLTSLEGTEVEVKPLEMEDQVVGYVLERQALELPVSGHFYCFAGLSFLTA